MEVTMYFSTEELSIFEKVVKEWNELMKRNVVIYNVTEGVSDISELEWKVEIEYFETIYDILVIGKQMERYS